MQLKSPNVARLSQEKNNNNISRCSFPSPVRKKREKRWSYAPKFMAVCALQPASSRCASGDVTARLLFTWVFESSVCACVRAPP